MKLLIIFFWGTLVTGSSIFDNPELSMLSMDQLPFILQNYIEPVMEDFDRGLEDSICKRDFNAVYRSIIEDNKLWAYKMVDAWAKPQTGLLTGNVMQIGNFDECVAIDAIYDQTRIRGQYCSAFVVPKNQDLIRLFTNVLHGHDINDTKTYGELVTFMDSLKISWGICIPSSCTLKDLDHIWNFTQHYFEIEADASFDDRFCDYEGKRPLTGFATFTIVFLGTIGLIITVSSVYDITIYQKLANKKPNIIIAFSAYSNGKRILSTRISDNSLTCLNGLRVISMVWIITAHRFTLVYYEPHLNGDILNEWKTEPQNMVFVAAPLAVDTFFVVSGFLVSYLFLQSREKGVKINIPMFYIHRLLRLTPSLAVVVLVFASLISYVGSGPFWGIIYDSFQRDCEKNWWATLLYIQNYVYPEGHCATHAWYLAVDTQLYILSPLILFPLAKWPRRTMAVVVVLAFASIGGVFAITWFSKLGSTYFDETLEFHKLYISTHLRASSWLIGILMGCIMQKIKKVPVNINKIVVSLLWIIFLAVGLGIIFGHASFTRNKYNVVKSAIFNSLSRPSWAIFICWIIFACTKGYGGVINKFLSLPVFNVLIKINYSMYMIHILPLIFFLGQGRTSTYFYSLLEAYSAWSDIIATIIVSFIWALAFESPIILIEQIIFKKGPRNSPGEKDNVLPISVVNGTDNNVKYNKE